MNSQNFIADLLKGFNESFQPLIARFKSAGTLAEFLTDFGWMMDRTGDIHSINQIFNPVTQSLQQLDKLVQTLDNDISEEHLVSFIQEIILQIEKFIKTFRTLSQINFSSLSFPFNQQNFWQTFPEEVLDSLLYEHLEQNTPKLFGILLFLGVLDEEWITPNAPGRIPYLHRIVNWERIPQIPRIAQRAGRDFESCSRS